MSKEDVLTNGTSLASFIFDHKFKGQLSATNQTFLD